MNLPIILSTHVANSDINPGDLAFARLQAFAADVGEMLAGLARITGRSRIAVLLEGLEGLHRGDTDRDTDAIRSAIGLLEELASVLCSIPPDFEPGFVVCDADRMLLHDLNAAVNYAGARTEDQAKALRRLLGSET